MPGFFQDPQAPDATTGMGLNTGAPTAPTATASPTVPSRDPQGNLIGTGPGQVPSTAYEGAATQVSAAIPKAGDRAGIRQWVIQTATQNGRPEIASNPDYYVDRIMEKGGDVGDGKWWTENIRGGGEMGGGAGGAAGSLGAGMSGDLLQPYTKTFSAPTGTDDPGFQFAVQQGQDAIQRSAAAKGTLLTGGTLKDLASYTTGAALQDYAGAYNRALNTFGTNYDVFRNNQNDPYQKLFGTSQLGLNAASQYGGDLTGNLNAANNAASSYATNASNLGLSQGNINAQQAVNRGNTLSNYANIAANAGMSWFNRPQTGNGLVPGSMSPYGSGTLGGSA